MCNLRRKSMVPCNLVNCVYECIIMKTRWQVATRGLHNEHVVSAHIHVKKVIGYPYNSGSDVTPLELAKLHHVSFITMAFFPPSYIILLGKGCDNPDAVWTSVTVSVLGVWMKWSALRSRKSKVVSNFTQIWSKSVFFCMGSVCIGGERCCKGFFFPLWVQIFQLCDDPSFRRSSHTVTRRVRVRSGLSLSRANSLQPHRGCGADSWSFKAHLTARVTWRFSFSRLLAFFNFWFRYTSIHWFVLKGCCFFPPFLANSSSEMPSGQKWKS